jgi:hypothetical protein
MSQRPRYADDGRLLVPDEVVFEAEGRRFLARHVGRDADPFAWTTDQLLLAESFARLDLADPHAASGWFGQHGMIDRHRLHRLRMGRPPVPLVPREGWDVGDPLDLVATLQETVRWLLVTLVRLSEHRLDRGWDPTWGRVVLEGVPQGLILGAPYTGEHLPLGLSEDELRSGHFDDLLAIRDAVADWPRVFLGGGLGQDVAIVSDEREPILVFELGRQTETLGTTWRDSVELVRILLEPRLEHAVERRFATEYEVRDVDGDVREVLMPREMRVWTSIIDPIYVQAFDALRRITEGQPGAATCRECGEHFLVLDARRRFFCNERERTRHAHRERRQRLAARMAGEGSLSATLTVIKGTTRSGRDDAEDASEEP